MFACGCVAVVPMLPVLIVLGRLFGGRLWAWSAQASRAPAICARIGGAPHAWAESAGGRLLDRTVGEPARASQRQADGGVLYLAQTLPTQIPHDQKVQQVRELRRPPGILKQPDDEVRATSRVNALLAGGAHDQVCGGVGSGLLSHGPRLPPPLASLEGDEVKSARGRGKKRSLPSGSSDEDSSADTEEDTASDGSGPAAHHSEDDDGIRGAMSKATSRSCRRRLRGKTAPEV